MRHINAIIELAKRRLHVARFGEVDVAQASPLGLEVRLGSQS